MNAPMGAKLSSYKASKGRKGRSTVHGPPGRERLLGSSHRVDAICKECDGRGAVPDIPDSRSGAYTAGRCGPGPGASIPRRWGGMSFQTNPQLELAFSYVRHTNKHLFLTGKAGSGKTTFLHQVKADGLKRTAVVAPTGVAAINAGGMTIHSLFQIPLGLHLPGVARKDAARHTRLRGEKIRLLRSLDLLIIDEISMVRADLLDAVDQVLQYFRGSRQPFGGVQLLMIGDLHQLPAVVKPDEWELLQKYYDTPFSLEVMRSGRPTISRSN